MVSALCKCNMLVLVLVERSLSWRREAAGSLCPSVGGVGCDLCCWPQGPAGVEVLEGRQIAANHILDGANDPLQSALVFGSGCGGADGDGVNEDGLSRWQSRNAPLAFGRWSSSISAELPGPAIWCSDCVQEAEVLHGGWRGGWSLPGLYKHLYCVGCAACGRDEGGLISKHWRCQTDAEKLCRQHWDHRHFETVICCVQ